VIYGDRESFPGRGKGKFKRGGAVANGEASQRCTVPDAIVIHGRVVNVCRSGDVQRDRRDGTIRRDVRDDDDDDDRKRLDKREKQEAKALKRANKQAAKEAKS
jgi:hypothetical protein